MRLTTCALLAPILLGSLSCSDHGKSAGQVRLNRKDGQRYAWIPPGDYRRGCSPGDAECYESEKPAHKVTISNGFWMGQTAVTVGAYKRYAQAGGKPMPPEPSFMDRPLNAGWRQEEQPIVNVTWDEARDFCDAAGGRLPTDAEREYAARAGTSSARYGSLGEIAWYADNSGTRAIDSTSIKHDDPQNYGRRLGDNGDGLKAVGQKLPNAFKLYDMLGNVYEWTADWYGKTSYSAQESRDPKGPSTGQFRVVRGGCWNSVPRVIRVSVFDWYVPSLRNLGVGFRCAGEKFEF